MVNKQKYDGVASTGSLLILGVARTMDNVVNLAELDGDIQIAVSTVIEYQPASTDGRPWPASTTGCEVPRYDWDILVNTMV